MRQPLEPFRFVVIALAGWMNDGRLLLIDYLREKNRVLREQLGGKRPNFTDDQRRRLAAKAKRLGRRVLVELGTIVTPETLLAWRRRLIAQKYDSRKKRGAGRPRTAQEIETLVVRLANENRTWGYRRIQGVLANLVRGMIAEILTRNGIEPAPKRERKTTWKEFVRAALGADCGRRLLHDRSLDAARTAAVHRAIFHRAVDEKGGDRWRRIGGERGMLLHAT